MDRTLGISLDSIAGIAPQVSTYADVLNLLGSDYEVERLQAHQTKRRLLPAKLLLRFHASKIVTVFIDPDCELLAEAQVTVVVVEGGPLRTADGLHVGMPMADAEVIIESGYQVRDRMSTCVAVESIDGQGQNYFMIHEEDGKICLIGLHRLEKARP